METGMEVKSYFSSFTGHSRGISILLKNTFQLTVHKELYDRNGNYLILELTLVALYGPNNDSPNFFTKLQEIVEGSQNLETGM